MWLLMWAAPHLPDIQALMYLVSTVMLVMEHLAFLRHNLHKAAV